MTTAASIEQYAMLIDGELCFAEGGKTFASLNPSTGEVFAQVADASLTDVKRAIASARRAFDDGLWSSRAVKERGQYLRKFADLVREEAKTLSELESMDVGKTLKQTTFIDVPTAADTFEYFAKAENWLKDETIPVAQPVDSILLHEPAGVAACIIPWNYPLIMTAWKIAPALLAGNTVILKPSPLASVSVLKLAQIIQNAGFPKGIINVVTSRDRQVAAELVKSKDVDMVSFSGGTKTGQDIMKLASTNLKKVILELGGKSPNLVFADCDLTAAVGGTMSAIFMNQGQMCTAGSRLLLEDKIYDQFMALLIEKTKRLKIGPAMSYESDFGPLISEEHRQKVQGFVSRAHQEGAKVVCGGKIPQGEEFQKGFYFEPTILTEVNNRMQVAQEEIFGPVLSVIRFSSVEEAATIANDTPYGLAASIWTKDARKAGIVGRQLRCGTVWVNTYGGFYNEVPFGGYKQSGFGRELGKEGLLEYTQTKHLCTDKSPSGRPLVSSWF